MHRFIFSLELYIFREGLRLSDSDDLPNPSVVSPCQYHDTASFNSLSAKLNWLGFSILHANVRNLKKNLEPLIILLSELNHPPHFIAITETKINKDTGLNFAPNMPGYSFTHSDTVCSWWCCYLHQRRYLICGTPWPFRNIDRGWKLMPRSHTKW